MKREAHFHLSHQIVSTDTFADDAVQLPVLSLVLRIRGAGRAEIRRIQRQLVGHQAHWPLPTISSRRLRSCSLIVEVV